MDAFLQRVPTTTTESSTSTPAENILKVPIPPNLHLNIGIHGNNAVHWLARQPMCGYHDVRFEGKTYRLILFTTRTSTTTIDGFIFLLSKRTMKSDLKELSKLDKLSKPVIVLQKTGKDVEFWSKCLGFWRKYWKVPNLTDEDEVILKRYWNPTREDGKVWDMVTEAVARQMGRRDVTNLV